VQLVRLLPNFTTRSDATASRPSVCDVEVSCHLSWNQGC